MEKLLHERLRDDSSMGGKTFSPSELEAFAKEIERCYIPRPRFEDGEPVQFEDAFSVPNITPDRRCKGIVYLVDGSYKLVDGMLESYRFDDCSRPTPKVYDADGVEIKVGDTVWNKESGVEYKVTGFTDEGFVIAETVSSPIVGGRVIMTGTSFTHERPVFDTDGVRICKGDTVWLEEIGEKHFVEELTGDGGIYIDRSSLTWSGDMFTHREPDSLEKLRDDMSRHVEELREIGGDASCSKGWRDRLTALIERGA